MKTIHEKIRDFWKKIRVLAIVCNQFGDSGKGKIIDLLALFANIIVRGTGGDNAGHTVLTNGKKYTFHVIPSGILYDSEGKTNIIGKGTVVNPRTVLLELATLRENNLSYNNLMISLKANLILPHHILIDRLGNRPEVKDRIGTTGRGIGPAYVDHYDRQGLIVNDLLNEDIFWGKLKRSVENKIAFLKCFDPEIVKQIMNHPHLENGRYYHNEKSILDMDAILDRYLEYGRELRPFIRDTDAFVREALFQEKNIILEGAQGLLLSIDSGTYPFVTSSDCSWFGLSEGCGINPGRVDLVLGVTKSFYMTRVGEGPFPTELGGEMSAKWCGSKEATKEKETQKYPNAGVNHKDEFLQGIGIRFEGDEYGATTGRPRRVGWLDLPLLRYAILRNGPYLVLTKLDVLDRCETIKICHEYVYAGPTYHYGERVINPGDKLRVAIPNAEVLAHCQPAYKEFEGWQCDISKKRSSNDLPEKLREILQWLRIVTPGRLSILSVGADREDTIF